MTLNLEKQKKIDISFVDKIKGYLDLTRAHFALVWPLLFCTGLMLAFKANNFFSWSLLIRVALIGLFGFEAGMVLNDIWDRNIDQIEPNEGMTKYWRPFKERPIPANKVSLTEAIIIFCICLSIAMGLIATLPFPNFLYVYGIMIYAYLVETFYNLVKRNQKFCYAQLLGRTDLAVFPIAGYLCFGSITSLSIPIILAFIYPWALAHLGTNDLADYENDQAKQLKTVTVLYGIKGNIIWISIVTMLNISMIPILYIFLNLGYIMLVGALAAASILIIANILIIIKRTSEIGLKVLPMFHASLLIYTTTIISDCAIYLNSIL
ncbi:MAG: UbiA family prenyltransferase [Candidatus Heimdallarchaeota archaeon]|nr:UbiA family prenyltransferase [Candidatus Heimdallarchaeota archaeon]